MIMIDEEEEEEKEELCGDRYFHSTPLVRGSPSGVAETCVAPDSMMPRSLRIRWCHPASSFMQKNDD